MWNSQKKTKEVNKRLLTMILSIFIRFCAFLSIYTTFITILLNGSFHIHFPSYFSPSTSSFDSCSLLLIPFSPFIPFSSSLSFPSSFFPAPPLPLDPLRERWNCKSPTDPSNSVDSRSLSLSPSRAGDAGWTKNSSISIELSSSDWREVEAAREEEEEEEEEKNASEGAEVG